MTRALRDRHPRLLPGSRERRPRVIRAEVVLVIRSRSFIAVLVCSLLSLQSSGCITTYVVSGLSSPPASEATSAGSRSGGASLQQTEAATSYRDDAGARAAQQLRGDGGTSLPATIAMVSTAVVLDAVTFPLQVLAYCYSILTWTGW